jgi:hypothetical protein
MTENLGAHRITIVMPSVEDFTSAVALVRATGARVEGSHVFVIDEPMTVEQVGYLLEVREATLHDGRNERKFQISIEPELTGPTDEEWEDAPRWYAQSPGPRQ